MNPQQPQPKLQLSSTADYRDTYANSVQVRVSLWDFFLLFGIANQSAPDAVSIQNFQGVFLSPQQAKALANVLNQNVQQYESTFGEIKLEPKAPDPFNKLLLPLRERFCISLAQSLAHAIRDGYRLCSGSVLLA